MLSCRNGPAARRELRLGCPRVYQKEARRGGDVLFEPLQLGYKVLDLLLDVFEMLRAFRVSCVRQASHID